MGVFIAAIFVDAVPGGDVDDAVAAAKYLRQLRAVQNGPLDEHGSLVQTRWHANIENDRRVAFVEQPGYEGLPEISRSAGEQHLRGLFPSHSDKASPGSKILEILGPVLKRELSRRRCSLTPKGGHRRQEGQNGVNRRVALTAGSRRTVVC